MKKSGFNLFGVPTLISILILILVYSVVAVVLVDVRQTRISIENSTTFIKNTYAMETLSDQKIVELNYQVKQFKSMDEVDAWISSLDNVRYDKETNLLKFEIRRDEWIAQTELKLKDENGYSFEIIKQSLSIMNNQDYTQNGDPVYGG
mgnify:CR=1 FL=1